MGENNCEQDLVRMSALGVASTGNEYWLASRYVGADSDRVNFSVGTLNSDGGFNGRDLFYADSGDHADSKGYEKAVRPVVKISLNS